MSNEIRTFESLDVLVDDLRSTLVDKKYVLLYAYNGTGKTRLSMEFKERGKKRKGITRDILKSFMDRYPFNPKIFPEDKTHPTPMSQP